MLRVNDKLIAELEKRKDEIKKDGYHQTIINIMYEHWQSVNLNYNEILQWVEDNYAELARFAVQIGKFNQQVNNGGFIQYYNNGYCGDIDDAESNMELHHKLVNMMKKIQLKNTTVSEVLKIINSLDIELDLEKYVEEEIYNDDTDTVDYEVIDNDDYMSITNINMLDKLDDSYYKVTDEFMKILEEYFKHKIVGN